MDFASRFHKLTAALEECWVMAKNCHVTAMMTGQNGLAFMYEVRPGPYPESFGVQVTEMAHVPPIMVVGAKRWAKHLEPFCYHKKKKQGQLVLKRFCQILLDSKGALLPLLQ